ncbi:GNAT family N-acetyltransferase [Treponema brennaborense]|uniref:GNAT family N-acetyltransferase n=1 Tax=Treponema brennaborense TaxID=81028 RepID=UPI0012EA5313
MSASNYYALGCFLVSGQYKGKGHGKALLEYVITEAKKMKRAELLLLSEQKTAFFERHKMAFKTGIC